MLHHVLAFAPIRHNQEQGLWHRCIDMNIIYDNNGMRIPYDIRNDTAPALKYIYVADLELVSRQSIAVL
jgi:hypothetical protein